MIAYKMMSLVSLSVLFLSATCMGSGQNTTAPSTPKVQQHTAKPLSCDEKLMQLVRSCPNFNTPFNKKTMHAEIAEKRQNGVYAIRLYAKEHGANSESTQGWLLLDTKNKCLKDITNDPDRPTLLRYDKAKYEDYVTNCLGIKSTAAQYERAEKLLSQLPMLSLPLEYSYDFIMDMSGTATPDKALMPLLKTYVDAETDLSNCHVAQLPAVDGYRLLLVCGNNAVGEGRFLLCSIDKQGKLTENLLIYTAQTILGKGKEENSFLHFKVNKGGQITLNKTIVHNGKEVVISKKNIQFRRGIFYSISD